MRLPVAPSARRDGTGRRQGPWPRDERRSWLGRSGMRSARPWAGGARPASRNACAVPGAATPPARHPGRRRRERGSGCSVRAGAGDGAWQVAEQGRDVAAGRRGCRAPAQPRHWRPGGRGRPAGARRADTWIGAGLLGEPTISRKSAAQPGGPLVLTAEPRTGPGSDLSRCRPIRLGPTPPSATSHRTRREPVGKGASDLAVGDRGGLGQRPARLPVPRAPGRPWPCYPTPVGSADQPDGRGSGT